MNPLSPTSLRPRVPGDGRTKGRSQARHQPTLIHRVARLCERAKNQSTPPSVPSLARARLRPSTSFHISARLGGTTGLDACPVKRIALSRSCKAAQRHTPLLFGRIAPIFNAHRLIEFVVTLILVGLERSHGSAPATTRASLRRQPTRSLWELDIATIASTQAGHRRARRTCHSARHCSGDQPAPPDIARPHQLHFGSSIV